MTLVNLHSRFSSEVETITADKSELERFHIIGQHAFGVAVALSKTTTETAPSQFVSQAVQLMAWLEAMDEITAMRCWKRWPQSPQAFGQYHRVGQSAMDTARLFARSVSKVVLVSRVVAIGGVAVQDIAPEQYAAWHAAYLDEVATHGAMPPYDTWPMRERHRDSELLSRLITAEYQQAKQSTTIPPEYRSKPISKKLAAKLQGRPNEDSGVRWLNDCIADGTISAEQVSRQSFVFDIRQFPDSTHFKLIPDSR